MSHPSPGAGAGRAETPLPTETIESVRTDVATVEDRVSR
ncbi:MAG: hypothetical protein JWR41_1360 [Modestobacter sp.]|jgi:hypothetical protein|nr:hypothetical protein [Modestobacter sp.]